jgi:hypothetical protein
VLQRHPESIFRERYGVDSAVETWNAAEPALALQREQVGHLERLLAAEREPAARDTIRRTLHDLYCSTFNAFLLQGLVETMGIVPGEAANVG